MAYLSRESVFLLFLPEIICGHIHSGCSKNYQKTVSKQVTPSGWKLAPSIAGTINTGRGRRTQGGGSRTPSCPSSGPVNKELCRSGPGDLKYRSRKVQLPWDRKSKRAPASTPAEDKGQASTPDDGTDPFQSQALSQTLD